MSNKSEGTKFEKELAQILSDYGWWVHLLQQNKAGQPADIIACKDSMPVLIDCKDCANDQFAFSRIESNQISAMTLWKQCGNFLRFFALKTSKGIYMMPYDYLELYAMYDKKSINADEMENALETIERWCAIYS